jgi:N,N'-diacetyllegionaminate synthase
MSLKIAGRPIGTRAPVFVVAEIGLNHGGSLEHALALVDAAASAGASAVKLQTLYANELVAPSCPAPAHVSASSLQDFFRQFELDVEAHRAIVERARMHGLAVLSTPFALHAVPMLHNLGIDAFKIASGDLTYDALIDAAARTRRPLIISTGMGTLDEAEHAVAVARRAGVSDVAVLHCVSAYPTPVEAENLRSIVTLSDTLGVPIGLSDHGRGLPSAIAAVALGACVYERHLMLERDTDVIDAAVSSTPSELKAIVQAMEHTRLALGDGRKGCQRVEAPNVVPSRRGLYARRALRAGEQVTEADVVALRPASALAPADLPLLVGSAAPRDIAAGAPFLPTDLAALERAS